MRRSSMQTGQVDEALLTTLAVTRWGDLLFEHFDDEIVHRCHLLL